MALVTRAELQATLNIGTLYPDTVLDQIIGTAESVVTEYLRFYAAKVDQVCCPVSVTPPGTGTTIRMRTVEPHLFQVGQVIELRGFGIPGYDRRLTITELEGDLVITAQAGTPFNPGISDPRPLIPNGTIYLAETIDYYDTVPEVREAALAIAVDVFQSRVAPGGQLQAVDFTPGPYRLGRSLYTRVSGLLARWIDTGSLVG